MNVTNGKILLRCDLKQKNFIKAGNIEVFTATKFDVNYRERSPTVAEVVEGDKFLKAGDILLAHHNLFYTPSPYHLYDDLFSIPFSNVLFARIDSEGQIEPICGNLIVNRIPIKTLLPVAVSERKTYDKMYEIEMPGATPYRKGQVIFTRPSSGYDIVYVINKEEKRITKVSENMICGYLKPNFQV